MTIHVWCDSVTALVTEGELTPSPGHPAQHLLSQHINIISTGFYSEQFLLDASGFIYISVVMTRISSRPITRYHPLDDNGSAV